MTRYYFREVEVSRGSAVRAWRLSRTYRLARFAEQIFTKAEMGIDDGGVTQHLAEAHIRIVTEREERDGR